MNYEHRVNAAHGKQQLLWPELRIYQAFAGRSRKRQRRAAQLWAARTLALAMPVVTFHGSAIATGMRP